MFKSTSYLKKLFLGAFASFLFYQNAYCSVDNFPSPRKEEDTTAILLKEITISSGLKNKKNSPLRLVDIEQEAISVNSAGRTFPELLKNIPGVFSTSETGSYGDAKINIRGYKQENIAVLLNGIPISGLTSGNMFWNNWMGLTDATANIQVQKGVGSSMLSDNSVGGTINIITHSPSKEGSLNLGYNYTSAGISKGYFNYNSGELNNGWGITVMGSYVWGSSWVEKTDINSWAYMASISKRINSKHSLLFTALGSPEKHEQRSVRLSYKEIEKYGTSYSKNWGYITNPDGSISSKTISQNTYHKPYFTLNHFYNAKVGSRQMNFSLNNAAYFAVGDGGGYWTETKGKRIVNFQKDGHIDWDAVVENNRTNAGVLQNATKEGSAQNIMADYMAGNYLIGLKSSFELDLCGKMKISSGLHYLYYSTWEKEKITDLLGANYWYEDYASNSLAGQAGRNSIKQVGDYIRLNSGKKTNFATAYAVISYKSANWNLELGSSVNFSSTKRWDKYNYVTDIYSKAANATGASVKAGALYKLPQNGGVSNSFYANAAFYSRVPYSSVFFSNGNNQISHGVKNEKNYLGEFGYRMVYGGGGVEATFYASYWKNKSLMSSPYKPIDEDSYKFLITGLDAFHYGVELDAYHRFTNWAKLSASMSFGSWKWKNNVSAKIYDPTSGLVAQQVNVYCNNLPVSDAPQTQLGANLELKLLKLFGYWGASDLLLNMEWQFNDRYWADFEPSTRTNANDMADPYRIPSYHLANMSLNYNTPLSVGKNGKKIFLGLFFNFRNIFNEVFVERGKDGKDHSADTFSGYWGEGRNFNFGVRIKL